MPDDESECVLLSGRGPTFKEQAGAEVLGVGNQQCGVGDVRVAEYLFKPAARCDQVGVTTGFDEGGNPVVVGERQVAVDGRGGALDVDGVICSTCIVVVVEQGGQEPQARLVEAELLPGRQLKDGQRDHQHVRRAVVREARRRVGIQG